MSPTITEGTGGGGGASQRPVVNGPTVCDSGRLRSSVTLPANTPSAPTRGGGGGHSGTKWIPTPKRPC